MRFLKHFLPEIPGFTHAALPTFHDDTVFFSARDHHNRSHVFGAYFNPEKLEIGRPLHVFGPGRTGSFDDCGVSICQADENGYLYVGWNLAVTVPFINTLCRYDNGRREIVRQRDENWISIHYGWRDQVLWYGAVNHWPLSSVIVGSPRGFIDYGPPILARPCMFEGEMWLCGREENGPYRIYRERSQVEIPRQDFDCYEQCYPCAFSRNGRKFLLYNGNQYGKTGFGLAEVE